MVLVDNGHALFAAAEQASTRHAVNAAIVTVDRPVWLLDVDGVINATTPGWGAPPRHGRARSGGYEFRLTWAAPLIGWIRELAASGTVDIRWCTTWCVDADELERLWRLPALDRAFTEPLNGVDASLAKLAAAREVLAAGHRLIWTDDREVPRPGTPVHAELATAGRALLIRPRELVGLQPIHTTRIDTFIAAGVPPSARAGLGIGPSERHLPGTATPPAARHRPAPTRGGYRPPGTTRQQPSPPRSAARKEKP